MKISTVYYIFGGVVAVGVVATLAKKKSPPGLSLPASPEVTPELRRAPVALTWEQLTKGAKPAPEKKEEPKEEPRKAEKKPAFSSDNSFTQALKRLQAAEERAKAEPRKAEPRKVEPLDIEAQTFAQPFGPRLPGETEEQHTLRIGVQNSLLWGAPAPEPELSSKHRGSPSRYSRLFGKKSPAPTDPTRYRFFLGEPNP